MLRNWGISWGSRVHSGALRRLEPDEGKLSSPVLKGGAVARPLPLPDNRLQQYDSGVLTQRTFNAANAQLTSVVPSGSITTSSFDANGNLLLENTGGALVSYSWGPENRLLSYESAATSETYQYSQDGLRKEKTNSTGTV